MAGCFMVARKALSINSPEVLMSKKGGYTLENTVFVLSKMEFLYKGVCGVYNLTNLEEQQHGSNRKDNECSGKHPSVG